MKQISRHTFELLRTQLFLTYPKPKGIILSDKDYKKLCKELKHKVKNTCDCKIVNYYFDKSK